MTESAERPFESWIGSDRCVRDPVARFPAAALAALLGHDEGPADALPLPWHWLYALDVAAPGQTGADGHPARGGFLPPVELPRRMWAASEIEIVRPLRLGEAATRVSTIVDIVPKSGRSGPLVFVTVEHVWRQAGEDRLREKQTIVYRGEGDTAPARTIDATPDKPLDRAHLRRELTPDPVMLFRYSALTYNAHRIHYDLPYARDEEGYRGLVVHGPLIATLLLDVGLPLAEGRAARHFAFRAQSPAFAGEPLLLHARAEDQAIAMWSTDAAGRVGMTARLDLSAHSTGRTPR
ncbi:hypothetical protein A3736_00340 [Erythrobacter sp. HI0063]|jgi:3-methylfumaryl-CoA hydratase|uniref:FAS1-like dehydratase domain-containing protein n=1 Tax=Erythrobacter sp. HI0063 TaxID=1822240 RepID=UPI0007C2F93D|nr:MaoC family dehydratase N-terminal domain-containing protein [Erythrobacter sp. HI0063]KZY57204.1 hypothetical protein A3736_00340 [Erythrobacter sp. HI0063]